MNRQFIIAAVLTVLWVGPGSVSPICAQTRSARATVTLKDKARLSGPQVRLGDIANITDTNLDRAAQLAALDLATFDPEQDITLERSFIEIRVLLAGYDTESVQIRGPQQITISGKPPVELTDLGVEQTVFEALCRQFSVAPDELHVKLVTPFVGPWIERVGKLKSPRLELMPSPQLLLGRVQLTVRILDGERVVAAKAVSFEIARKQPVVVAVTSLDRMQVVTASNIREEFRFVDHPIDRLTADQVIGRKVLLPFRPEEIITLRHVGETNVEESPILVHARDAVRIVARKHGLTVTVPVAEAMQSGKEGQLIRVRNIHSNQIVTGVVVARGEVEVRLP